jgi:hypothetical protein
MGRWRNGDGAATAQGARSLNCSVDYLPFDRLWWSAPRTIVTGRLPASLLTGAAPGTLCQSGQLDRPQGRDRTLFRAAVWTGLKGAIGRGGSARAGV